MKKMEEQSRITLHVTLAITGGVFMIIGAVTVLLMNGWPQSISSQFMKDAMMNNIWKVIMPQGVGLIVNLIFSITSLAAGALVLVGAYQIQRVEKVREWGLVVIVASVIGLVCSSGFGIGGALLGLFAGIIAVSRSRITNEDMR